MEYTIHSIESSQEISKALAFSMETVSSSVYVSRFYPEIYRQLNCKYLSAACFYLLIHHAALCFELPDHCSVNLETDRNVFNTFYAKLNDFDFHVHVSRPCDRVSLRGTYHRMPFSSRIFHENTTL